MGYPVPANSPQITVSGTTYAVGAFDWDTPIGHAYYVGIFAKQADGTWSTPNVGGNGVVIQYMNDGEVLADIRAKGGKVKYMQWLIAKINTVIAAIFAAAPPNPNGEPTTEVEARAFITAAISAMKLTLVNGVPVLQ